MDKTSQNKREFSANNTFRQAGMPQLSKNVHILSFPLPPFNVVSKAQAFAKKQGGRREREGGDGWRRGKVAYESVLTVWFTAECRIKELTIN